MKNHVVARAPLLAAGRTRRTDAPGPEGRAMKPGIVAVICLAVPMLAMAAERRSSFTVTVTVPPRAALTVLSEPVSIDVTSEDLEAGYKDVEARYLVDGNDPRGFLLRVAPR